MPKVYTKTGDAGETSLLGNKRVRKSCLEIDAIGEVDEVNALFGVFASELSKNKGFEGVRKQIVNVQHKLFVVGSNLAAVQIKVGEVPKIVESDVEMLEKWIDEMESELDPLTQFILPGGHEAAAHAFLARAICRRAERHVVELASKYKELDPLLKQYLNRLSDVLFVLARWVNMKTDYEDVIWKK